MITEIIDRGEFEGVMFLNKILLFFITIIMFINQIHRVRFKFSIMLDDWELMKGTKFIKLFISKINIKGQNKILLDLLFL